MAALAIRSAEVLEVVAQVVVLEVAPVEHLVVDRAVEALARSFRPLLCRWHP